MTEGINAAKLYEVQKGDNLWNIAKNTLKEQGKELDNTSIWNYATQIGKENNIKDINVIYANQHFKLPGTEESYPKAIVQEKMAFNDFMLQQYAGIEENSAEFKDKADAFKALNPDAVDADGNISPKEYAMPELGSV